MANLRKTGIGGKSRGTGVAAAPTGLSVFQSLTNQSATAATPVVLDGLVARPTHALYVLTGAGVSAGVVTLQVSHDGANWFSTATTVTTNAASAEFAAALSNFPARYVQAKITTVITGGTVSAWVVSAT